MAPVFQKQLNEQQFMLGACELAPQVRASPGPAPVADHYLTRLNPH